MKMLNPKVEIRVTIKDLTPGEAGEISQLIDNLGNSAPIEHEWAQEDEVTILFTNIETYEQFQLCRPSMDWAD